MEKSKFNFWTKKWPFSEHIPCAEKKKEHIFECVLRTENTLPLEVQRGLVLRPVGWGMCVFSDPPKPRPGSKPTLAFLTAHWPVCVRTCTSLVRTRGYREGGKHPWCVSLSCSLSFFHTQQRTHTHQACANSGMAGVNRASQAVYTHPAGADLSTWPPSRHLHSLSILTITHTQKACYISATPIFQALVSWRHFKVLVWAQDDLHSESKGKCQICNVNLKWKFIP